MTVVRTAVLLLLATAAALVALIAAPRPAHGCSPPYPPISLSDYAADTEVAFAGRQIARIEPNDPSYHRALSRSEWITLIFEVERVFKGQAGPLLAARTAYGGGDCGVDYGDMGVVGIAAKKWEEGGWRVGQPGDLLVSIWVSQYAINELEEEFGPGYPPDETMLEVAELLENPDDRSSSDVAVAEEPEAAFGPGYPEAENAGSRNGASAVTVILLIGGAAAALLGGALVMRNRRRRSTREDAL